MPPATPAEVVKIMRAAYAKAMADPALLEDAKKAKFEVEFVSGEELQKLADNNDQPAAWSNQACQKAARAKIAVKRILGWRSDLPTGGVDQDRRP